MDALSRKIESFTKSLNKYEGSIASFLTGRNLTAKEFILSVINSVKKTPALLDCESKSLFGAILLCAEFGLLPNTPDQHVFIRPKGIEVDWTLGYKGIVEIAYRSPRIKFFTGIPVYQNEFYREYDNGTMRHIKYTGLDMNILELCSLRTQYLKDIGASEEDTAKDIKKYKARLRKEGKGALALVYATCTLEGSETPLWRSVTKDVLDEADKLAKASGRTDFADLHNTLQTKIAVKLLSKYIPKEDNSLLAKAIAIDDSILSGKTPVIEEGGKVEIVNPEKLKRGVDKIAERLLLLLKDCVTMEDVKKLKEEAQIKAPHILEAQLDLFAQKEEELKSVTTN